jgi:hypothetical protein
MSRARASALAGVLVTAATGLAVASAVVNAGHARAATGQPSASPLIAYLRYGAGSQSIVWIARPTGGDQRRLGPGAQPLISSGGGYYVAASSNTGKGPALLLYSTEGGSPRTFFGSGAVSATPLAWSADGRYLAAELLGSSVNSTRGSGLAVIDTRTWKSTMVAKGIIYGASFNPRASSELVYASALSLLGTAPSNLRTVNVDGGSATLLTHDGRSLFPVWGSKGIVFDRERPRGVSRAPAYQVWLMAGSRLEQLTSLKVAPLVDGLVPLDVSADGNRILAEFVGEDTSDAWTIQVSPRKVSQVMVGRQSVQGAGISSDGRRLLVDVGDFEQSPSHGGVETLGFGGGGAVKVVPGANASWNG